eukprot:1158223-Pelagomonas_calceolata.AAC.6
MHCCCIITAVSLHAHCAMTTGPDSSPQALEKLAQFASRPDSSPKALKKLVQAQSASKPAAVKLLCYKRDGTPFWGYIFSCPLTSQASVCVCAWRCGCGCGYGVREGRGEGGGYISSCPLTSQVCVCAWGCGCGSEAREEGNYIFSCPLTSQVCMCAWGGGCGSEAREGKNYIFSFLLTSQVCVYAWGYGCGSEAREGGTTSPAALSPPGKLCMRVGVDLGVGVRGGRGGKQDLELLACRLGMSCVGGCALARLCFFPHAPLSKGAVKRMGTIESQRRCYNDD